MKKAVMFAGKILTLAAMCGISKPVYADRPVSTPNLPIIQASNSIGFRLLEEATKIAARDGTSKNTMLSPISAYQAFSMALNGSDGETREQFAKALKLNGIDMNGVNESNHSLQKQLVTSRTIADAADATNHDPIFSSVRSLWSASQRKFTFAPDYLGTARTSYGADVAKLDFLSPEAAEKINGWGSEKTNGMVKKIIEADVLKELVWVILDATYFQAQWRKTFAKIPPQVAPVFVTESGRQVQAPMIAASGHFSHLVQNGQELIELPFLSSGPQEFVMQIALDADQVESSHWSNATWNEISRALKSAGEQFGSITLPKFSFDYGVTMFKNGQLAKASGLNFLFQDTANFSAIGTPSSIQTQVGIIRQNTRIELDENGVKAAAVTLIGGTTRSTSVPPRETFNMVVDRPFSFTILEKTTGAVLFAGRVIDPTQK